MVSITSLVQQSGKIALKKQGITLLLPEGRVKQQLLEDAANGRNRFARISAHTLAESEPFKEQHGWGGQEPAVYIIAPGDWNSHSGYYALICKGAATTASLDSCGYIQDRKGNWTPKAE